MSGAPKDVDFRATIREVDSSPVIRCGRRVTRVTVTLEVLGEKDAQDAAYEGLFALWRDGMAVYAALGTPRL